MLAFFTGLIAGLLIGAGAVLWADGFFDDLAAPQRMDDE